MSENSRIISNNAKIILKNLKDGIISPKDLTQEMRHVCVEYLHRQGEMNQEDMAELLHVSTRTIRRDLTEIEKNYASLLSSIDYKRIIGTLLYEARNLRQKAMAKQDYRFAWQIESDLIDKYMELGLLEKSPEELLVKTEEKNNWTNYLTIQEEEVLDELLLKTKERRAKERMNGSMGQNWLEDNNSENGEKRLENLKL